MEKLKELFPNHIGVIKEISCRARYYALGEDTFSFQEEYKDNKITYISDKNYSYHIFNNIYSNETLIEETTVDKKSGHILNAYIIISNEKNNQYMVTTIEVIDSIIYPQVPVRNEEYLVNIRKESIGLDTNYDFKSVNLIYSNELRITELRKKVGDIIFYTDGEYAFLSEKICFEKSKENNGPLLYK